MKTKPLNNNVLIEVQRNHDGVARVDENEVLQYGILRDFSVSRYHLTASAALRFYDEDEDTGMVYNTTRLKSMIGKVVRWEQYAEGGQTFEEDGKTYALIPFWRLISVTDNE